jgi:hypothetical protein
MRHFHLFQIDKDFDRLYPGKGHSLYEKWPVLADKVLQQIRAVVKDKCVLQMAGKVIGDDADKGERNISQLNSLMAY